MLWEVRLKAANAPRNKNAPLGFERVRCRPMAVY